MQVTAESNCRECGVQIRALLGRGPTSQTLLPFSEFPFIRNLIREEDAAKARVGCRRRRKSRRVARWGDSTAKVVAQKRSCGGLGQA